MNGSGSGLFIVVEGPEGAGKSTLVRWLAARLRADGRRVVAVRQPGGTPVAEAARKLALQFPHEVAPVAELFLFLAARADLVHHVIRPALEQGQVVVADRFDLSTIAYQVAGAGLPAAEVAQAIRLATGGLVPDVTLVLDVPVELGRERQRTARKVQDRIERQDDAFHARVREAYRRAQGPGVVHIDASLSRKAVQEAAWREVTAAAALSTRGMSGTFASGPSSPASPWSHSRPAASCCNGRRGPRGPSISRRACSRTCWRTWPTTTSTRSPSDGSTRWRSTACWTSSTTHTPCS